jgi:hypothetical protein
MATTRFVGKGRRAAAAAGPRQPSEWDPSFIPLR